MPTSFPRTPSSFPRTPSPHLRNLARSLTASRGAVRPSARCLDLGAWRCARARAGRALRLRACRGRRGPQARGNGWSGRRRRRRLGTSPCPMLCAGPGRAHMPILWAVLGRRACTWQGARSSSSRSGVGRGELCHFALGGGIAWEIVVTVNPARICALIRWIKGGRCAGPGAGKDSGKGCLVGLHGSAGDGVGHYVCASGMSGSEVADGSRMAQRRTTWI